MINICAEMRHNCTLRSHYYEFYLQINHLNDTHKQLMVHWVGEGSNVIICLARDPTPALIPGLMPANVGPSAVYISYDYGDTYNNKTELFKVSDGPPATYATLEKFYNHPKYNTHVSRATDRGRPFTKHDFVLVCVRRCQKQFTFRYDQSRTRY